MLAEAAGGRFTFVTSYELRDIELVINDLADPVDLTKVTIAKWANIVRLWFLSACNDEW